MSKLLGTRKTPVDIVLPCRSKYYRSLAGELQHTQTQTLAGSMYMYIHVV
jgi:hypothetical protein